MKQLDRNLVNRRDGPAFMIRYKKYRNNVMVHEDQCPVFADSEDEAREMFDRLTNGLRDDDRETVEITGVSEL